MRHIILLALLAILCNSCSGTVAPAAPTTTVARPSPVPIITTPKPSSTARRTTAPTTTPTVTPIIPTILPTPTDPTDFVWPDLVFGPCVSCELESANVKVNLNGFISIGQEKDLQRWLLALDETQSSPYQTYLIIEITRHRSSEQAKEYSLKRKSGLMAEHYTDFQASGMDQLPKGTWMMQKDRGRVILGSSYDRFEFVIKLATYIEPYEKPYPFADLNNAAKIVVVASQAQFKNFQWASSHISTPSSTPSYPTESSDHGYTR